MKYCIPYWKDSGFKYFNEINELLIMFNEKNELPQYINLLQKFSDKIIIFTNLTTNEHLDFFKQLQKECSNFKLEFNIFQKELIKKAKENKLPFFINDTVSNWDSFLDLIHLGVTDIVIGNELGFELEQIAEIAHQNNIQIRVCPNVLQGTYFFSEDIPQEELIKMFFIRPEDLESLAPYIDVIFFFHRENNVFYTYGYYSAETANTLSTLYKIYAKDKQWFGDLGEIIIGLPFNYVDSHRILPSFMHHRKSCGKRCLKGKTCNICLRIIDLAHSLKERQLIIK